MPTSWLSFRTCSIEKNINISKSLWRFFSKPSYMFSTIVLLDVKKRMLSLYYSPENYIDEFNEERHRSLKSAYFFTS
jgi:hypothetical protein